jgi:hypothetical protein
MYLTSDARNCAAFVRTCSSAGLSTSQDENDGLTMSSKLCRVRVVIQNRLVVLTVAHGMSSITLDRIGPPSARFLKLALHSNVIVRSAWTRATASAAPSLKSPAP